MRDRRKSAVSVLIVWAAGAIQLGCAFEPLSEEMHAIEQRAVLTPSLESPPWSTGDEVHICFTMPDNLREDHFRRRATGEYYYEGNLQQMQTAFLLDAIVEGFDAVMGSWGEHANLDFYNETECPDDIPAEWVSILVRPELLGYTTGLAQEGKSSRLCEWCDWSSLWQDRDDIQVAIGAVPNNHRPGSLRDFRAAVVQQIGRVLGLNYEYLHADAQCEEDSSDSLYTRWTEYDPNSVMGACAITGGYELSELDILAITMMFPPEETRLDALSAQCYGTRCIDTGKVIIMGEGTYLVDDWMDQGAYDHWSDAGLLNWSAGNGEVIREKTSLHYDDLPRERRTIFFAGRTRYNGTFIRGKSIEVHANQGMWTAVVMATL
jgi:hypothetical protein